MGKPHKHAAEIKAWADGAEVEFKNQRGKWEGYPIGDYPSWSDDLEYRIKPEPEYPKSSLTADEITNFIIANNGDMKELADFIVARHCQDQEKENV